MTHGKGGGGGGRNVSDRSSSFRACVFVDFAGEGKGQRGGQGGKNVEDGVVGVAGEGKERERERARARGAVRAVFEGERRGRGDGDVARGDVAGSLLVWECKKVSERVRVHVCVCVCVCVHALACRLDALRFLSSPRSLPRSFSPPLPLFSLPRSLSLSLSLSLPPYLSLSLSLSLPLS